MLGGSDHRAASGSGGLAVSEVSSVLSCEGLHAVYQPIVDLGSGEVVAFEALVRGPRGTPLARPDDLFPAARAAGRLAELDLACRAAALAGARAAGLPEALVLFVNCEPEVWEADHVLAGAGTGLRLVVELTERALTVRPAELLRSVDRVRASGCGVALDDVGADPASLALIPLVRPDVIKLDMEVAQVRPTAHAAAVVSAVGAAAERSGAVILAEGIETGSHLAAAVAAGATLGQGWYFGRPAGLPPRFTQPVHPLRIAAQVAAPAGHSAFEIVASRRPVRPGAKPLLVEVSKHLERMASASGESALLVATFQDVRHFGASTRRRYAALARRLTFVGVLGVGMPDEPDPGVRGGRLADGDPVRDEWVVAVLGPHFAAALVAREVGAAAAAPDRRFDVAVTHDREIVVDVVRELMARIAPAPPPGFTGGPGR